MVGIDQQRTRIWFKLSYAETPHWQLSSRRQTPDSGDYWWEANNLSSAVSERVRGTALGVIEPFVSLTRFTTSSG